MYEREWMLGDDLYPEDNLLDPITFDELILTVRCNCRNVTADAVVREAVKIIENRLEDAAFLVNRNAEAVAAIVRKEREQ